MIKLIDTDNDLKRWMAITKKDAPNKTDETFAIEHYFNNQKFPLSKDNRKA